jgi:hypothetical protein
MGGGCSDGGRGAKLRVMSQHPTRGNGTSEGPQGQGRPTHAPAGKYMDQLPPDEQWWLGPAPHPAFHGLEKAGVLALVALGRTASRLEGPPPRPRPTHRQHNPPTAPLAPPPCIYTKDTPCSEGLPPPHHPPPHTMKKSVCAKMQRFPFHGGGGENLRSLLVLRAGTEGRHQVQARLCAYPDGEVVPCAAPAGAWCGLRRHLVCLPAPPFPLPHACTHHGVHVQ